MFQKIKEEKGFTLAELLVVVAIIGVLVAVSIPIFTAQLEKARLATNQANARAAYAAVVSEMLSENMSSGSGTYNVDTGRLEKLEDDKIVSGKTDTDGTWISVLPVKWTMEWAKSNTDFTTKTAKKWKVVIKAEDGTPYFKAEFE